MLLASAVGIAVTTCGLLAVFVTSAMAPQLRTSLGVTPTHLGFAVALFFGASAITSPLGGRLADRMGSVRVMRGGLILAAACLLCVTLFVHGWVGLICVVGCAGVTNGTVQPAANRYISRLTAPHRQGLAFGIKQAAIPTAVLLGGLSVPAAVHVTGWRVVYLAGAVLAVCVAAAVPAPAAAFRAQRVKATPRPLHRSDLHALVVLAVGWALASAGANALGAFFVLGAVHTGFTPVTAALLAVAGSVASIAARVIAGFAADRSTGSGLGVVAAMSGIGAVGVALLATNTDAAFFAAILVGFGLGWGWAGVANYAVVRAYPELPGKATGITGAGGGTGACLGPLTFGLLVGALGYELSWVFAGLILLASVVFILLGRSLLPNRTATP